LSQPQTNLFSTINPVILDHGICGLWFVVWGLGFGICGLGFVVWGLWFGVWDLGIAENALLIACDTNHKPQTTHHTSLNQS
jgi:hypothetical protein